MTRSFLYGSGLVLTLFSCYPIATASLPPGSSPIQQFIYYLGDTFTRTDAVDVYYDPFAIPEEYIVVGSLTNVETARFALDAMKEGFIFRAKSVGADGILFDPLELSFDPECDRCLRLKARVIKYTPKQ
jgi:hypothetical protein